MILLPQHRHVFISTPRAGSHTMFRLLERHYGGERIGRPPENIHPTDPPVHAKAWRRFTTCRNPYARARSAWHWATRQTPLRDRLLAEIGSGEFLPFCRWLADARPPHSACLAQVEWHTRFRPNAVLRIECLDTDGREQLPWWQTGLKLPRALASEYADGRPDHTPATAHAVQAWAMCDFEAFGYPLGSWRHV